MNFQYVLKILSFIPDILLALWQLLHSHIPAMCVAICNFSIDSFSRYTDDGIGLFTFSAYIAP